MIIWNVVQVDQDVDEPWPLEVYGHDGIARNITMEPGTLMVYFGTIRRMQTLFLILSPTYIPCVCVCVYCFLRLNIEYSGDMVLYESHSVIHGR